MASTNIQPKGVKTPERRINLLVRMGNEYL
jgi:hypothetical protein